MRALLVIVVVVVLAYAGYEYVYLPRSQTAPQGQAQQAGNSAQDAVNKAGQALGQAADAIKNEVNQLTGQAKQATQSATQQAGDAVNNAGQQAQNAGQQAKNAGQQANNQAQGAAGSVDVGSQVGRLVDDVKSGLQQANNSDTANAARGKLDDAKNQMNGLGDQVGQLPTAARQAFASTCSAALPTIRSLADQAKNSQAGKGMAPTIDAIVAKFEEWSKPPA